MPPVQTPAAPPPPPAVANVQTTTAPAAPPGALSGEQQLAVLRARRSELSRQLNSAEGRRKELTRQIERSDRGPARASMEGRASQLDQRILQIESDLADVGRQMSSAPMAQAIVSEPDISFPTAGSSGNQMDITAISVFFIIFVLTPLAVAGSRWMWKRTGAPATSSLPRDTQERLERMESAIDTIAIEIERISEGQRFVTKLMSEPAQLGAGQRPMEPIKVPQGDAVRVAADERRG